MENEEITPDILRLDDNGYLVEETYVINDQEENNSDSNCEKHAPLREQDRFLPIANIAKIMKRAIPDNGKIAKDARECVQECISEFISFITSEASDRCQVEKRKTINGEDVLYALNTLGFDNYVEPLKLYLKKYREIVLPPLNVGKLNKTIVIYGGDEGIRVENDSDAQTDSAVLYAYPKVIGDFTIA